MKRGEVYLVNLNPVKGSEQAGQRPAIIYQDNRLIPVTLTVIIIPLTTNLKLQHLPSGVFIPVPNGGLNQDSVALCHQVRALDKAGLIRQLGSLNSDLMDEIDRAVLRTIGIKS